MKDLPKRGGRCSIKGHPWVCCVCENYCIYSRKFIYYKPLFEQIGLRNIICRECIEGKQRRSIAKDKYNPRYVFLNSIRYFAATASPPLLKPPPTPWQNRCYGKHIDRLTNLAPQLQTGSWPW